MCPVAGDDLRLRRVPTREGALGAQAVALFTPPTLVVKLGIVTAVASFGIIGLRSEGCLPV
jgi:hypothetical protein